MGVERSDLADVRRALAAASADLEAARAEGQAGDVPPPALATAVERLLEAVAGMADLLDRAGGDADEPSNAGVIDESMPADGPKFDRARPRRGYGHGR